MNSPERLVLMLPEGLASARALCNNAASEALAPDPELYVSDWADQHRRLSSKTSAEVGQWQTTRTPYLREIMNALSLSHPATDGDFKKGTQIGGSEAYYNAMGAIIDQSPCPMMLVMPTTDTAKRTSRQRLQPMFDETPSLSEKVGENKSRDASNTVLMKDFPGGMLILAGANSGPGLRSSPVRVLLMDEIDAYPDDVDGEGRSVRRR
jgi:phage terminase large subunit GpA-like protein